MFHVKHLLGVAWVQRERFHVKHQDSEQRLIELCHEIGLSVGAEEARTLVAHLAFVLDRNKQVNLTAIKDEEQGLRLHVLDSLVPVQEMQACPEGPILDVGTGGGFPGLPLAIVARRNATLLDSVGKKVSAVDEFLAEQGLGAQIRVEKGRAEDFATTHSGEFAAVVARAVSQLPSLVELAAPLLKPGGCFVALKAAPDPEEVARGDAVARIVGLGAASVRGLTLPGGSEARTVLCYRRERDSSVSLPRRAGLAQRKPLA